MKKIAIIAIVVGVLLGIGGATVYRVTNKKQPSIQTVETKEAQKKLLDWKDPNGFSFQYPEGVTIDKHDEDTENYAHIEMKHPSSPGTLLIWGKDTTAADVSAWVKTEKTFRDASVVDTTLGGKPAKKILLMTPIKKIIVGTIFDEILWYTETEPGEGDYWQKTFDTITSTFTFTPLIVESSGSQDNFVEDAGVDEEEVVE